MHLEINKLKKKILKNHTSKYIYAEFFNYCEIIKLYLHNDRIHCYFKILFPNKNMLS